MEGKVETCSASKFRTGSCKHFNLRIFTSITCDLLTIYITSRLHSDLLTIYITSRLHSDLLTIYITSRLHSVSFVTRPSITANAVEGLTKLLRIMTSGGCLEAWLIMPCMH